MTAPRRASPLPADQRRSAIVVAALPLVLANGRAVTTRQIADAAGVAEGTIFHVFEDKDALLAAVVDSVLQPGHVAAGLREIDVHLPLHDRIVRIVEVLRARMVTIFELMTALGISGPPEAADPRGSARAADQTQARAQRRRQLAEIITDLLRPDVDELRYSPAETTELIRLFTFAACHPAITDHQPLPAAQIADVLIGGITTHPPCSSPEHAWPAADLGLAIRR